MSTADRLRRHDTDLFEARPTPGRPDPDVRRRALDLIAAELATGEVDSTRRAELEGVVGYLEEVGSHYSEGRDLGVDKRSFSTTELGVAQRMDDSDLLRYLVYRYRFNHYPRAQQLLDFPLLLAIEPTSICNLRCIMCFQDDPRLSRNRELLGRMDFDLYRRIVDEGAKHGLAAIVLASRGEPMLHDRIFDMIRYAKGAGILDVKMNTNATRLTPERSRELLASGLDTLVFSVDAATKEDFERIRVRANFDKVVENIDTFNEIRAAEFSDAPLRTRISMVVIDERQDVQRAEDFWASRVDEFAVRSAIPRVGIYEQPPIPATRPCSLLWERLYVWWDGTVNPCDEDYLSRLAIGNVADGDTVASVWKGSAMTRYRRAHAAREKGCLTPCDRCPGF